MHKLRVGMLLLPLLIASCTTVPQDNSTVGKIVQAVRLGCSFEIARETVNALLRTQGAWGLTAVALADRICQAVTTNPKTEGPGGGRTTARLNGVRIQGHFIR